MRGCLRLSLESEAAVQAGIEWLVRSQQGSGRWNASEFGAGVDREADGQQREPPELMQIPAFLG